MEVGFLPASGVGNLRFPFSDVLTPKGETSIVPLIPHSQWAEADLKCYQKNVAKSVYAEYFEYIRLLQFAL